MLLVIHSWHACVANRVYFHMCQNHCFNRSCCNSTIVQRNVMERCALLSWSGDSLLSVKIPFLAWLRHIRHHCFVCHMALVCGIMSCTLVLNNTLLKMFCNAGVTQVVLNVPPTSFRVAHIRWDQTCTVCSVARLDRPLASPTPMPTLRKVSLGARTLSWCTY